MACAAPYRCDYKVVTMLGGRPHPPALKKGGDPLSSLAKGNPALMDIVVAWPQYLGKDLVTILTGLQWQRRGTGRRAGGRLVVRARQHGRHESSGQRSAGLGALSKGIEPQSDRSAASHLPPIHAQHLIA
jgi:hypothetical protein